MGRIFLLSMVGYTAAIYPKSAPILPPATVKILSRISNLLFLPALIIAALGKGLTAPLFARMSIIIPFCFLNEIVAYGIAFTLGRLLHEDNVRLYTAVSVAIGSPNVVSFPLMIMDTLCKQSQEINQDYESTEECFIEATSMIFVYSIGWQFVFWGYGFPKLQTLVALYNNPNPTATATATGNGNDKVADNMSVSSSEKGIEMTSMGDKNKKTSANIVDTNTNTPTSIPTPTIFERIKNIIDTTALVFYRVFSSPVMIAALVAILIGITSPIQNALFIDFTGLTPFGDTIQTLADPVICLNCLIMSASLAQVSVLPDGFGGVDDHSYLGTIYKYFMGCYMYFYSSYLKISGGGVDGNGIGIGSEVLATDEPSDDCTDTHMNVSASANFKGQIEGENTIINTNTNATVTTTTTEQQRNRVLSGTEEHILATIAGNSADGIAITPEDVGTNFVPDPQWIPPIGRRARSHTEPNVGLLTSYMSTSEIGRNNNISINVDDRRKSNVWDRSSMGIDVNTLKLQLNSQNKDEGSTVSATVDVSVVSITDTDDPNSNVVKPPAARTVIAMVLCRLIISPLIILPICSACMKAGWVSQRDRAFMLIVILEAAAPSAQLMIVASNQLGLTREASQLAYLYIFQYLSAIITITIWVIAAIMTLY